MTVDKDTRAAKSFYREIRSFAENAKPWDNNAIWHDVMPDEKRDFSLISKRIYGNRDEFLAVMAAAGIDHVDQGLAQKKIVLPNAPTLFAIKRKTGFESIASLRKTDKSPTWAD